MRALVKSILIGGLGVAVLAGAAQAADILEIPPLEPMPEVPVEIGSGWYLRGDVSYDFESKYDGSYRTFSNGGCNTCGFGYDSQDYDEWKIDSGVNFGAGFGYQFTDYFRGDVTAHYWKHDISGHDKGANCVSATCGSWEDSDARAWEVMANAYVDLGTFAGLTPYIGGGLGAVNLKYSDFSSKTVDGFGNVTYTTMPGESDWRFAYSLMAGVSYDLTQALKLDIGYRYVNVDSGDTFGFDSFASGNGAVGVQGTDKGFDRHTIQAGLRYSLF